MMEINETGMGVVGSVNWNLDLSVQGDQMKKIFAFRMKLVTKL